MINSDYHVHSNFSSDAKVPMEQMIEKAISLGLQRLCFTDHIDFDYPEIDGGHSFMLDFDEYFEKLAEVKHRYKSQIEIYKGIELGLQPHIKKQVKQLIETYDFDFIIGATHVIDRYDPYYHEYWENHTTPEGITRYFQSIIDNCKSFDEFHVYAHLDYIVRYAPDIVNGAYSYETYKDIIDEALETIIHNGKGMEVNTSGYKYGFKQPHPKTEILRRYKEMGGEIITIGSDAHETEYLGYGFQEASDLLKSLGYKYYTIFIEGKPRFERL